MILEKFKLASVVSRRAAVKRIRCPIDVLAYALIEDPDWNVRMSAAEHVGCPVEAMRKYNSLKIDENVTTLIQHPSCPGDILAFFS